MKRDIPDEVLNAVVEQTACLSHEYPGARHAMSKDKMPLSTYSEMRCDVFPATNYTRAPGIPTGTDTDTPSAIVALKDGSFVEVSGPRSAKHRLLLDYVLGSAASGAVTLEILDAQGAVVRSFSSANPMGEPDALPYFTERWINPPAPPSTAAGHHRFVWDLRFAPPRSAGYEFMIAAVDGENTPIEPRGPLVVPGRYTVRLTVGGQRYEQPLVVIPDPRTAVSAEVLASKLEFQEKIVAAMGASFDASAAVAERRKRQKTPGDEADTRLAALEADLSKSNHTLGAILNQVEAADAPATAIQAATLAETLQALDVQLQQSREFTKATP